METDVEEPAEEGAGGAAGDDAPPEAPSTKRRFLPSSIGLTVLLPPDVTEIEARISWGDYRTEPPLSADLFLPDEGEETGEDGKRKKKERPFVEWVREPKEQTVRLAVPDGRGSPVVVPESAAPQRSGGGLTLETHARLFDFPTPDGDEQVRALTVFLVNRRAPVHRFYADVSFVFQARLELVCAQGFRPRRDVSGYRADDFDLRVADLHYRDVCEWAVGRNAAAAWDAGEDQARRVTRVWTDPLPQAEVERVAPNEDDELKARVTFGMEALAERAGDGGASVGRRALRPSGALRAVDRGRAREARRSAGPSAGDGGAAHRRDGDRAPAHPRGHRHPVPQRHRPQRLPLHESRRRHGCAAAQRGRDAAIRRRSRRRNGGRSSSPSSSSTSPAWPIASIADREIADLLFFPTGGGKTEAYLGLAAFVIAHRRLTGPGVLGAGVAVIMRYTLRLLTLDQLARAAGVVCALELMRTDPKNVDEKGRRQLGDWPIEIGLWVGSDASPNRLGGKGDADQTTAVGRVRRYKTGQDKRAPAPIKACPGAARRSRRLPSPACRTISRRRTWRSAAPTPPATSRAIVRCRS